MRAMLSVARHHPVVWMGALPLVRRSGARLYAYEITGEPWLLDLAKKLRAQGVDFEALMAT